VRWRIADSAAILVLSLVALATPCGADDRPAPWADRELPVSKGLALWIDAARQGQACEAIGVPPTLPGGPAALVFDGSGHGRHLVQRTRDAWPTLVAAGDHAALSFDGRDDHLGATGLGLAIDRFSAFLVAAPRANSGGFRGLLAANRPGRRDYESGFTIDLGPFPTPRFETLNVEGAGFGGFADLLDDAQPFGRFHVIEVHARPGRGGVSARLDGRPQGQRDRQAGTLGADELTLGARFYSNEAVPHHVQGFFEGQIAEVLLYDRLLSDDEAAAVRAYLARKHAGLSEALAKADPTRGKPWPTVADPPPVQVLVPGFRVRELPLRLTNINNVKYRPDGKLFALAYNGDIHFLSDRDGDGLEDHAEPFWENQGRLRAPIGMALTPPGYPRGAGVFVASKGKVSLIVDEDGDDRADREIVVASGWPEAQHGVDALGVAVADDGSVYFGLGTPSFTNAYLTDDTGRGHYDPNGLKGTILRVSPDFGAPEIIATGIRFPVALAFNDRGDLFATDQEGATWLPNGNPFDELLHIERGRHYGFPPRHPRHLPGVIDEPSVFDYRPQHQSTCGLNFNGGKAGEPVFGPEWWAGDALVCGYSRGKLFRTKLVASPAGYVARTALVAVLGKLTVDACVAPDGSLVVATHSGAPDWGSGPDGAGTLYKVRYADRDHPQPLLAWSESAREVRVAFDRPLGAEHLRQLSSGTAIESGRSVSAGDRFETLRPGYAVVAGQLAERRFDLPVRAVNVSPDRRMLVLETDPMTEPFAYSLTLPGLGRPARDATASGELPQEPAIDLAFDLTGAQAEWRSEAGDAAWSGWLPHLDLSVAKALTAGSAEHDRLWALLEKPGTLTLRTQLDLKDLLRPAVQPGSRIDYAWPPERARLRLDASAALGVRAPPGRASRADGSGPGASSVVVEFEPDPAEPAPIEIALRTGADATPRLDVSYSTNEDPRPRALPLVRILLPWARRGAETESTAESVVPPELAGGNWARGRALFYGTEARCGSCHTVRGVGGQIGPDLSNLAHRDLASVLRDIQEPSAAIHPDHITYTLALRDGRVLTGTVRSEGDTLHVGDGEGQDTPVPRDEVEEMQPAPISTMPEGLAQALGPKRMADLLAFLLTPDLEPAPISRPGAPPPRTRAEVETVLGPAPSDDVPRRPLNILLVAGPKDHGIDEHDYPLWQRRWASLFGRAEGVTVAVADGWPDRDQLAKADVLVMYSANPAWNAETGAQLDAFLARGGGLVLIHYAVNGQKAPEALERCTGLAWRDGQSRFRHGPLDLQIVPGHPITTGLPRLKLEDESYWNLTGDASGIDVLATGIEEGEARPLVWARTHGRGRVFVSIPGHYTWTFDDPPFRVLLLRGIAWSAGEPLERFRDLVTVGARISENPETPPEERPRGR
jgi:putative heme-binding domain-containing protein